MEENKLSDYVFQQIKDFTFYELTKEQESIVDELILNEELRECYKENGLCKECKQPNTGRFYDFSYKHYYNWCQTCNGKRFQQNFGKWSSGNQEVDEFIQRTQLKVTWAK